MVFVLGTILENLLDLFCKHSAIESLFCLFSVTGYYVWKRTGSKSVLILGNDMFSVILKVIKKETIY